MSQAPLQDPCLWIHVSASMCISGSSARSMLPDSKLSSHMYLRILYKIHVFRFMSQHLCISRILCKIHVNVSGFMSLQLYISGSSASSMSPDPCLRIHVAASTYLRNLCKIHVSGSVCISGSSARSMSPIHVSASLYLRVLCKIHVFGFMSQHLRISGSSARSMCPIHVLAFMSQHPFISQDPLQDPCLRSLSIFVSQDSLQDPCLRIHVSASTNMDPLQDPRLWAHVSASLYLRLLCKIHVPGSVYKHPYVSQDPLQDPCVQFMS